MTNVFISYRRDDTGGHAGRLADRLEARFGADQVFVDVEDIQPGQNFEQAIEQTLSRCDHLLAVIGPRWTELLESRAASGEDFVRHEIAVGLARGMRVIPVLVGGASMPAAVDLPKELAALARCQAVEIRDQRFDEDSAQLLNFLSGGRRPGLRFLGPRVGRRTLLMALAAVAVIALGLWLTWPIIHPVSIDGEWVADLEKAGQKPFRVAFTLTQVGRTITGEVRYPTGNAPIYEGHRDGNRLYFFTQHTPDFSSNIARITVEAEPRGEELQIKLTYEGGVAHGIARRVLAGAATAAEKPVSREPELPSLTYGVWTLLNARDEEGKTWNNSVLEFTSQSPSADGLELRGRFTWRLDNVFMGTEEFTGHYVARTRQVILAGQSVSDAPGYTGRERLAIGSYSAVLSSDERVLSKGRWGSSARSDAGFAGEWEAAR